MYGAMLMLHRQACMKRPGPEESGRGPDWCWVGSACAVVDFISGVRRIVVPCCKLADTRGLSIQRSMSFSFYQK